jgi:hypothetical protein
MPRSSCFPDEASDLSKVGYTVQLVPSFTDIFLRLCKSFDCIQTIVNGESTVYQVVCTRGRLRGRILALKKVGIFRPVYIFWF